MPSVVRNSLLWLFEPLEDDPGYLRRRLFNLDSAYVDGLLCLCAGDRKEPWNGLLVCTSHDRQAALISEFPELSPHPILGKWLYLSQNDEAFETIAVKLVRLALARDSRLGVEPGASRKKTAAKKALTRSK